MKIKRIIASAVVAAALGLTLVPATGQARECIGVRGVICVGGKQCITDPCFIDP